MKPTGAQNGLLIFQGNKDLQVSGIIMTRLLRGEKVLVAQLWLTLCDPMNCSPPGSSIHKDYC